METGKLIERLKIVIEKKQKSYEILTDLAEQPIDTELKEIFGQMAYEEFVGLCTLLGKYEILKNKLPE